MSTQTVTAVEFQQVYGLPESLRRAEFWQAITAAAGLELTGICAISVDQRALKVTRFVKTDDGLTLDYDGEVATVTHEIKLI